MEAKHTLETIFNLYGGKWKFRNAKPTKDETILKNFVEQDYFFALEYVKKLKPKLKGKIRKLYLWSDRGMTTLTCAEMKDEA